MSNEKTTIDIIDSYQLSIITNDHSELFDLKKNPDPKSYYVQEVKRKLMSSLDLNIVVENLYTTADLIYVSQNALDGTVARQEISGLQIDLANLCGESQVAMTEIHSNTANMLNVLPTVFNLLVLGKTTAAMKILSSGSQYAQNMANAANSLAGKVELMIDKATNALLKSEELYASDEAKKRELEAKLKQMKIDNTVMKEKVTAMEKLVSDIQADYLEAKAKEDKADKRAFTMGIISSVTGILDFGLSSAISSLKPAESSELSDEEKANLKSEYEAKVKKLEAQITTLEESLQEPDLSEEDTTRLTGELDEKKEELKTLEDGGSSKWIASAASAVIGKISADTKDAQGQAQAAADKAADNATALQQKKYEVQKEQIELNANLKQLAEEIKNQTSEHTTLETAIKMLQLALKCLGNIVTALQSTAIFWRGIESGCKSIATDSLLTTIDALEPLDIETQQTIYLEDSFMGQMLNYMSTWVALNIISEEYGIASTAAGEKTRTNIKNPQFGADAYRTAQSMAEEILARML